MIPIPPALPSVSRLSDIGSGMANPSQSGKQGGNLDLAALDGLFASALDGTATNLALPTSANAALPEPADQPGNILPLDGKAVPDRSDKWIATLPEGRLSAAKPQPESEPFTPDKSVAAQR